MKFAFGTRVFSSDGEEIGAIKEVIVDPGSRELVGLVVQEGLLFQRDQVVDVSLVESTDEDGVRLSCAGEVLEEQAQEYREDEYVALDPPTDLEGAPESVWIRPPDLSASLLPPGFGPIALPPEIAVPIEDVTLLHGSSVSDVSGEIIGSVEALLTDSEERITHVVVSEGIAFPQSKLVPLDWVASVEDNAVSLSVSSAAVGRLPDYQP